MVLRPFSSAFVFFLLPLRLCARKRTNKKMGKRKLKKGKATQTTKEISWSVLPSDVEYMILSSLPATSLMRFRCVCKHWCSLVSDPHFIKMQLNRSIQMKEGSKLVFACDGNVFSLDVQAYRKQYVKTRAQKKNHMRREHMILPFIDQYCNKFLIVSGSCNGILLLSTSDTFYLLNPATKEYKRLPFPEKSVSRPSSSSPEITIGFGYSPRTDEYKVIMIRCYVTEQSAPSDVYVYTLETNSSWRTIEPVPYVMNARHINPWQHALVNGVLHWMAIGRKASVVPVSFDLGDEKFRDLSLPKSFSKQDTDRPMGLVKFCGFLSLYHFKGNENLDFWIMKDYGDEQSWTKEFSVARPISFGVQTSYIPLGILKKDEVVLFEIDRGFFILCLVKEENLHIDLRLPASVYGTEMYSESLVSLRNDGGVGGGNKQERREKEGERSAEDAKSN